MIGYSLLQSLHGAGNELGSAISAQFRRRPDARSTLDGNYGSLDRILTCYSLVVTVCEV